MILDKFYDYQLEAFDACQQNDKGIVCMPTGTGKTYVQAGVIANDILENPGFRMYIVNAPRIMLSFQLLEEVFKFNISNNIDARYMAVHSGGMDQTDLDKFRTQTDIEYSQIVSSTSPNEVSEMIQKAKDQNQPLIFFSTYNSALRIEQGRHDEPINIIMNDESHYLVQERFNTDFNEIVTERKYFFTATTKETPSDEGLGMNNVGFYGERIYTMTPAEAIKRGKIVRPRVHVVSADTGQVLTQEDLDKNLGKLVMNSFNEHGKLLRHSVKAKMLIAASGLEDMKLLIRSREIKDFMERGGKFYAVASDQEVNNYINGERVGRREFLKQLQKDGSNPDQELIVIHYDILTEGIDVPGLTGVLFLRDQRKAKFIQTFGRVARLHPQDRERIASGEITPDDLESMNKPYAWIIIPALVREDDDKLSNLTHLIEELRDFEFNPAEDIEPKDDGRNTNGGEEDGIVPEDNRVSRLIAQEIEEFEHRIEEEQFIKLFNEKMNQDVDEDGLFPEIVFEIEHPDGLMQVRQDSSGTIYIK